MNLKYMRIAIKEAKKAKRIGEVPVGAVVVKDDVIIAKAYNKKEKNKSVISHAEILAILKASKFVDNWRLDGCEMYVTLEPCPMCASAIKQARISSVYCGISNSNSNNGKILSEIFNSIDMNPKVQFINNILPEEIKPLLQDFFVGKRKVNK